MLQSFGFLLRQAQDPSCALSEALHFVGHGILPPIALAFKSDSETAKVSEFLSVQMYFIDAPGEIAFKALPHLHQAGVSTLP